MMTSCHSERTNLKKDFTIWHWMISKLGLSKTEILAYALIFDSSEHGKKAVFFSYGSLAKRIGVTDITAKNAIRSLIRNGFIYNLERRSRIKRVIIQKEPLTSNNIAYKEGLNG